MRSVTAITVGMLALYAGPAAAQSGKNQPAKPLVGKIARNDIPNEYLEISLARGSVTITGVVSDTVEWDLAAASDLLMPGQVGPARIVYNAGYPGAVGINRWTDRYSIDVGDTRRGDPTIVHPDLVLKVPQSLRILHVTIRGGGKVDVSGFAGEISVVIDSGNVSGNDLRGPIILEARRGGITLDLSSRGSERNSVNLLSRYGTIALTFGARPSATFELTTNCGHIRSDFQLTPVSNAPPEAPGARAAHAGAMVDRNFSDADCSDRPKTLPPLPGVKNLRYSSQGVLGEGSTTIHASALQGDIEIKRKGSD